MHRGAEKEISWRKMREMKALGKFWNQYVWAVMHTFDACCHSKRQWVIVKHTQTTHSVKTRPNFCRLQLTVWGSIVNVMFHFQLHYEHCHHFVTKETDALIYPNYVNCCSWTNQQTQYCSLLVPISTSCRAQLWLHYSVKMSRTRFCNIIISLTAQSYKSVF